MNNDRHSKFLLILSGLFWISAIFHGVALQWPYISIPESPANHAVFVVVNAWFALQVWNFEGDWVIDRPPNFYRAYLALSVHQLIVHGYLLAITDAFDTQSFVVLLSIPVVWALLVYERAKFL